MKFDREIILENGKKLIHSEQMELTSKVMNMLINGQIQPIKTEKITTNSIKGDTLTLPTKE